MQNYESTIKSVKLALPVMYSDIVKFVCDIAEKEMGGDSSKICPENTKNVKNYYVLILLMAGVVDDFK